MNWYSRPSYRLANGIQPETTPPKFTPRWFRRHWASIVMVIIFFLVLPLGLVALVLHCPMIIIVNSKFLVQPGDYVSYSFTENSTGNHGVYGSFSSNSPVSMYLMSASQFATFISTRTVSSSILSVGPITSYDIPENGCPKACVSTVFVQQGTYYLVFDNANNSVGATVTITWPNYGMHADSCS
jgi:hypothetical protein